MLIEDANTPFVDNNDGGYYEDVSELDDVKLPVRLLMLVVLHLVYGSTEDRLKSVFRMFKE